MRLKLDENLSLRHTAVLAQDGHDVATVYGEDLSGSKDQDLIGVCKQEGRSLVSLDMGYANTLLFDPRQYPGIIVLRQPVRPAGEHIDQLIETLRLALLSQSVTGKLWIVEIGRVREHQLEDESQPV